MKNKKCLIVFNPQTGKKGLRYLDKLIIHLGKKDLVYDIHHTESNTQLRNKKSVKN